MKAVMMSIQPKWCELISSGKKTVEFRKTKPKIAPPFKVSIYCTKGKPTFTQSAFCDDVSNGKVVGEFVCDKIYDITPHFDTPTFPNQYICGWDYGKEFDCLSFEELTSYLNGKKGYGWHISDLVIYDEPRDLWRFCKPCDPHPECDCEYCITHGRSKSLQITRPPQSWCYVERREI